MNPGKNTKFVGMKRLLCIFLLLVACLSAAAQNLVYDLNFEYIFDNREYDKSQGYYSKSMTINGARLTPMGGIDYREGRFGHSLMLGLDIVKDMGKHSISDTSAANREDNTELFREIVFYYSLKTKIGKGDFDFYGGVLPRRFIRGFNKDCEEFISDSLRWFDRNMEGVLLKYQRPRAFFEAGCDWNGMFGHKRREEIEIFTDGEISIGRFFKAGWKGLVHHYANSAEVIGVMDDALLEPYVDWELNKPEYLDQLRFSLSWLQGFQQDRRNNSGIILPCGAQFEAYGSWKGLGIDNRFFFGSNMMPFYANTDAGGNKYGSRLYWGDPFYRIHVDGSWRHGGAYDRAEIFWKPQIGRHVSLDCSLVFHFTEFKGFNFAGWQQTFSLIFDLEGGFRK